MPFTRMPWAAHSVASVRVSPARPDFDAPYGAAPAVPTSDVSEHTLRMLPPFVIRRAAAWAQKKAPFRLVSTILSHCASPTSSDAQGSSTPALLTRISIRDVDRKT